MIKINNKLIVIDLVAKKDWNCLGIEPRIFPFSFIYVAPSIGGRSNYLANPLNSTKTGSPAFECAKPIFVELNGFAKMPPKLTKLTVQTIMLITAMSSLAPPRSRVIIIYCWYYFLITFSLLSSPSNWSEIAPFRACHRQTDVLNRWVEGTKSSSFTSALIGEQTTVITFY